MNALQAARIDAAISALTLPGITLKGLAEMPIALTARDCPLLGPSAYEPAWVTDWEALRVSLQGNHRNAYTLNYTYYQAPVGTDRGLFYRYPDMLTNVAAIATALEALPRVNGCQSLELLALPQFGPVHDASGQLFIGATFALRVIEF